jgi:predicted N-acetyltransferase YhbS
MDLISPDKDRHLGGISDLFSRTFGDYWTWMDYNTDGYLEGAPYDWAASRIGVIDGELATHFGVWDFTMRIGAGAVRVACIGAVATDRRHRTRGLMSQTAADSVKSLKSNGYDMSLLFGIPKYYTRFGYVGTFSKHRVSIPTRSLKTLDSPVQSELFDGDYTELADQYNQENEGITGTFVRPTYTTNRRPKMFAGYTFDGGYLIAGRNEDELQVADCAGPPEMVLNVAAQIAARDIATTITFVFVPDRSRMGEYLQTISHTRTEQFTLDGGPMIKVVNLQSTIQKIAWVLSGRLQASALADYSGRLVIRGDEEHVALVIQGGVVAGVEPEPSGATGERTSADDSGTTGVLAGTGTITAGAALARLIIGDNDPVRVCSQSGIKLEGDARYLVPVLFPDQEPSTTLWDQF